MRPPAPPAGAPPLSTTGSGSAPPGSGRSFRLRGPGCFPRAEPAVPPVSLCPRRSARPQDVARSSASNGASAASARARFVRRIAAVEREQRRSPASARSLASIAAQLPCSAIASARSARKLGCTRQAMSLNSAATLRSRRIGRRLAREQAVRPAHQRARMVRKASLRHALVPRRRDQRIALRYLRRQPIEEHPLPNAIGADDRMGWSRAASSPCAAAAPRPAGCGVRALAT